MSKSNSIHRLAKKHRLVASKSRKDQGWCISDPCFNRLESPETGLDEEAALRYFGESDTVISLSPDNKGEML